MRGNLQWYVNDFCHLENSIDLPDKIKCSWFCLELPYYLQDKLAIIGNVSLDNLITQAQQITKHCRFNTTYLKNSGSNTAQRNNNINNTTKKDT
jgi:hypothetical protein